MIDNRYPGIYLAFEGGEGCGKTTQQKLLVERLKLVYPEREIIETREPGGTLKAEEIRKVIFGIAADGEIALPIAEALLFAASRHQSIARIIRPALERGAIVISDRCFLSSLVYQGIVRDLGWQRILRLNEWAMEGVFLNLIIYPDIDPEIGLRRKQGVETNRFDEEKLDFHRRVREGYLFFAEKMIGRMLTVDGSLSIEEQAKIIRREVSSRLAIDLELKKEVEPTPRLGVEL